MAHEELKRFMARRAAARPALDAQLQGEARAAAAAAGAGESALPPGTRVFDRVTGLEGVVLGGRTENVIVPASK